jgi:hypothetical protein
MNPCRGVRESLMTVDQRSRSDQLGALGLVVTVIVLWLSGLRERTMNGHEARDRLKPGGWYGVFRSLRTGRTG